MKSTAKCVTIVASHSVGHSDPQQSEETIACNALNYATMKAA